ncbi:MAG: phytoene/squalene synthase family protein [Chthoniobacterales bacterium]|nr:phytoene/squalene synthase family protein [Chthoniobacterales bacterium]MCX7712648.1 phytoene/squalene synthase family protein [Chthoniobacterales bacterium]
MLKGSLISRVLTYLKSNLALAMLCLPKDQRKDMEIFYSFCRFVDDIADKPKFTYSEKLEWVELWQQALIGKANLPVDLQDILTRRHIKPFLLQAILQGVEADIHLKFFRSFEDLKHYCWCVAGAVGLACNQITGCKNPKSEEYAVNLGLALQLTNILRDVGEDAQQGRIYFPLAWLEEFGERPESWLQGHPGPGYPFVWKKLALEARNLYSELEAGPPNEDKTRLKAAEAMRLIYNTLFKKLTEVGPTKLWNKKVRLPLAQKLLILFKNPSFFSFY